MQRDLKNMQKKKDAIRLFKCKLLRCKKNNDCLQGESFVLRGISKNNQKSRWRKTGGNVLDKRLSKGVKQPPKGNTGILSPELRNLSWTKQLKKTTLQYPGKKVITEERVEISASCPASVVPAQSAGLESHMQGSRRRRTWKRRASGGRSNTFPA